MTLNMKNVVLAEDDPEISSMVKDYFDEKIAQGIIEDCGFAPGGDWINGFAIVNADSHAEAWYALKAFPGYEIVAKYDLIPLVEYKDYYAIELEKEA